MTKEFIIGLGGTGCRSVAEFRRMVQQHRADIEHPDRMDCSLEYLCIDTNTDELDKVWDCQQIQLKPERGLRSLAELLKDSGVEPWIGNMEKVLGAIPPFNGDVKAVWRVIQQKIASYTL